MFYKCVGVFRISYRLRHMIRMLVNGSYTSAQFISFLYLFPSPTHFTIKYALYIQDKITRYIIYYSSYYGDYIKNIGITLHKNFMLLSSSNGILLVCPLYLFLSLSDVLIIQKTFSVLFLRKTQNCRAIYFWHLIVILTAFKPKIN